MCRRPYFDWLWTVFFRLCDIRCIKRRRCCFWLCGRRYKLHISRFGVSEHTNGPVSLSEDRSWFLFVWNFRRRTGFECRYRPRLYGRILCRRSPILPFRFLFRNKYRHCRCLQWVRAGSYLVHEEKIHRLLHFEAWGLGTAWRNFGCTDPPRFRKFGHVAIPIGSRIVRNSIHDFAIERYVCWVNLL